MPSMQSKWGKGLHALLHKLSNDEEDTTVDTGSKSVPDDPQRPWLHDFHIYMDVIKQVPEGCTAIQWWGVSIVFLIS